MKNLYVAGKAALIAVFLSFASSAAETNVFYTVTVGNGTHTEPVSLDTLSVTVERPDAEPQTKTFGEACADFANGPAVFRKRGTGWMMSSVKMAEFTGEIRVEEGGFMVNTNLMTGPQSVDTAPNVVVSNGATFALASTAESCPRTSASNGLRLYNRFILAGSGVDNLGAIANMLVDVSEQYCFNNDWTLTGDTLLSGTSRNRVDMTDKNTVYMNGHTLTIKKGTNGQWSFYPGSSRFIDGNITVDETSFNPQSSWSNDYGWMSGPENTLTLTNNAILSYYNTSLHIPWTLVLNEGSAFCIGGIASSRCDLGYTNTFGRWNGPLIANGPVRIYGKVINKGLVLGGPMSGPGPIKAGSGWLQLLAKSPDYKGAIHIRDNEYANTSFRSGLALYTPGAYDPGAVGVTLTNAELHLMTDEIYDLPPVSAHVAAGTNYTFSGGHSGSRYASFLKTGPGILDLESPVSVTGRLEVAGGTLRLPPLPKAYSSLAGGLWKAVVPQDDDPSFAYMGLNNSSFLSNEVVTCCDMMKTPSYPPWEKYASCSWGGYVWNRSETNETWRFAVGVSGYSRLWIDGQMILSTDDNGKTFFYNKDMTPGPHAFLFKVNPRGYSHPGSINAPAAKNKDWKDDKLGIAVCRTSTVSTNSDDFVFLENTPGSANAACPGGDGILFTTDTRDITDFDSETLLMASLSRRTYSNVVCRAGTTVDLGEGNELPLYTPLFEGVTTVTNGGLTVRESWTLRPEDLTADGGMLKVCGKLEFRAGATLEWEDLSSLPRSEYVIATATEGISGMPAWNPPDRDRSLWRLSKGQDAAGNDTLVFGWHAGTAVIIR